MSELIDNDDEASFWAEHGNKIVLNSGTLVLGGIIVALASRRLRNQHIHDSADNTASSDQPEITEN